MVTVGTNETCADNWSHVAVNTFVVIMSCKTIGQQRQFDALKVMSFAFYFEVFLFGRLFVIDLGQPLIKTLLTNIHILTLIALKPRTLRSR